MFSQKKIKIYSVILIAIIHCSVLFAQVRENVDPTVAQFPIIRGSGDPDYTGDVNVSIPLMTVPGRGGLNFDITLQYVLGNGVPISESASWAGLGWNLNMNEITCDPVNDIYGFSTYYFYRNNSNEYVPDFYYLNSPEASTSFWMENNTGTSTVPDYGIMHKWGGVKIHAYKIAGNAKVYDYFVVYGMDGTKYVYAEKLRKDTDGSTILLNHNIMTGYLHSYYYVYKLSAILAPNYQDGGGNPLIPGDGSANTDKGGWIKFIYSTATDINMVPSSTQAQQINYLEKIVTPTHTAELIRYTDLLNPFIIRNQNNAVYLECLHKIVLKKNNALDEISSVKFTQTTVNGFDWLADDGTFSFSWASAPDNSYRLRPKLESIKFYGKNSTDSLPSYNFAYYDNLPTLPAPYYIDSWGYLTNEYAEPKPQNYFIYGMLKSITYPTGGKNSYEYESDYFQPERNSFRNLSTDPTKNWKASMQGGLRLKKQIVNDPQTNQNQVYEYLYGEQNAYMKNQYQSHNSPYPGVGFLSSDPGLTQDYEPFFSINNNIRNDVHYPDVTVIQPDGSKIVKYYTSACTDVELFNSSTSQNADYRKIFRDNLDGNKLTFTNLTGNHTLLPTEVGSTYQPYIYVSQAPNEGQISRSSQASDSPFIDYFGVSPYSIGGEANSASIVNDIILGETRELDDCNSIFTLYTNQPNYPDDYYLAKVRIAGLDNGWKRGYLSREEKLRKLPNVNEWELVSATDFYYEMVQKNFQDYTIFGVVSGWPRMLFTALSGWVKLTKKVETTY